jgi:hypothetical protein
MERSKEQYTMKRGQHDDSIKRFQEQILLINPHALPRYGADGWLGDETFHAIATLLKDESIEDADAITKEQEAIIDRMVKDAKGGTQVHYLDVRAKSSKAEKHGLRSCDEMDLVWHQTDCEMGEREERYYGVPVHFVVTSGGKIIQLHSVEYLVYGAHALNRKGISIEVEGHFEGIEGNPKTYPSYHKDAGRTPQKLTDLQIQAAFECARIIKGQVEALDGKLRYQLTHRQGTNQRTRDPGSEICKKIILPLSTQLGVPFPWELTWGKGQQVPKEWHPESTATY